jgi:hypothetical protein
MNRRALTLLVLTSSLLSACAPSVYRSPGAEAEDISRLAVLEYNGPATSGVVIAEIDGKPRGMGFFRRYELAPGERTLKILLNLPSARSEPVVLTFPVLAGETYELKYETRRTDFKGGTWRVWIENRRTGHPVASRQG